MSNKIVGNMIGSYSQMGKTLIFVDDDGNEVVGVITDKEQIFTATDNDVREGSVYASDAGVSTGTKVIPSYHTTEAVRAIPAGSKFIIPLPNLDTYDYTKLQALICNFNTSMANSVSTQKVSILDKVYDVNSTIEVSAVLKDHDTKSIDLGITNTGSVPCVIRFFTYKEID